MVVFIAAAAVQSLFWAITWDPNRGPWPLALVIAALLVSALAAWGCGLLFQIWRQQQGLQDRLLLSEGQLQTVRSFLGGSLRMDSELLDAASEEQVMETALSVISDLTGAKGASFIPLDDWGQPLPAHTYGKLPAPLLKTWTESLLALQTRSACKSCQKHQALAGDVCPLLNGPFTGIGGLYCYPLQRGDRLLGMLNLYLPGKTTLSSEVNDYLKGLLNEAAIAIDGVRLRNRELSTLRQVQMLRSPRADLPTLLQVLLEGVGQALEVEAVRLVARGPFAESRTQLQVDYGSTEAFNSADTTSLAQQIVSSGQLVLPGQDQSHALGAPLLLPDGRVLGAILLASSQPLRLDDRRLSILQSVAGQASFLIENEREMLSLEYRTVIQERARLAREIHDGLAQTLAFLKLQAAQMQTYLSQGNFTKLAQVLKQNYDALADAYLDTRQAIDDLRMAPQQELQVWLEQMLADFERASNLKIERVFTATRQDLSPEIQAQLMRIIQEALNNVRKHAHASKVRVMVHDWNGDLVVEISDDGRGFSPEDVPGLSQHGLRGMSERAELMGADFQVISKPEQGTTIKISISYHPEETLS